MPIFDDMLTSYRGAGVIGTVMGIFVLGGFIFLSMFAFDPHYNGSMQSIDSVIATQAREITLLESQLADAKRGYLKRLEVKGRQSELEVLLEKNEDKKEKLAKLGSLRERVKTASVKIDAEATDYIARYRDQIRTAAVGEVLPEIQISGRPIKNAVISQVTPAGIHVKYDEGISRIPVDELPEELRERFQFDATEVEAYLARERARLGQMEESIEAGVEDKVKSERIKYLERRVTLVTQQLNRSQANLTALRRQRGSDPRAVEIVTRAIKECQDELTKLERELDDIEDSKRARKNEEG